MTTKSHTELAALREKFEAWMRRKHPAVELAHRADGSYWSNVPDAFWEGFQAGAALSHPSTGQWMPIESAPEGVMLLFANMKAMEARNWCWVGWLAGGHVCGIRMDMPTHWMPLPPPPQGDKT